MIVNGNQLLDCVTLAFRGSMHAIAVSEHLLSTTAKQCDNNLWWPWISHKAEEVENAKCIEMPVI